MTRLSDLHFRDLRYLGSAFYWGCNLVCFQSTMLFAPSESALLQSTSFLFLSIVMTIITRFLVAIIVARKPKAAGPATAIAFSAVDALGILAMVIALYQQSVAPTLYIISAVLIGIGSGWLDALWLHVYGGMRPENTSALIPLATSCGVVVYFVSVWFTKLSPHLAVWMALALPILSGILLASCLRSIVVPLTSSPTESYFQVAGSLWKAVAGAAIFSLISGTISQMSAWRVASFADSQTVSLIVSGALSLALFLMVVLFKRKADLSNAYRAAVPLLFVGCLLLPLLWAHDATWSGVLVSAGNTLFDLVVMCLIAEAAYDYRVSGAVISGVARGITITASAIGTLLGFFLNRYVTLDTLTIVSVSIVTIYLLATGVVVMSRRKKASAIDDVETASVASEASDAFGRSDGTGMSASSSTHGASRASGTHGASATSGASAAPGAPAAPETTAASEILDQSIAAISDRYHLSRREAEIFNYVARGRSAVYIADILFVSQNTIRSHMRRIYDKLGVHSKQELLDLVDDELGDKTA